MTSDPTPMLLVQPERRRYEAVVDSLLNLVEARNLGPGDALPTERELSQLFGVSRNVLRQAFSVLEERGLLTTLRGSGRYLRNVADSDAVAGEGIRARVEVASIADLLEARMMLEGEIAALACQRRTAEQAQSLLVLAGVLTDWEDNVAFHCAVAACTHNFVLERMVRQQLDLASELHQREHYKDPDQLEKMRVEHQDIANAVAARDSDTATELVRRHLRAARTSVTRPS